MPKGFPHGCGDGPFTFSDPVAESLFSPRVWGWSAERREERVRDEHSEAEGLTRG